ASVGSRRRRRDDDVRLWTRPEVALQNKLEHEGAIHALLEHRRLNRTRCAGGVAIAVAADWVSERLPARRARDRGTARQRDRLRRRTGAVGDDIDRCAVQHRIAEDDFPAAILLAEDHDAPERRVGTSRRVLHDERAAEYRL